MTSKFIKILRSVIQYEQSGKVLYKNYPLIKNYPYPYLMIELLKKYDTKANQLKTFMAIYEDPKNGGCYPFGSSIYQYIRTYDQAWYKEFQTLN